MIVPDAEEQKIAGILMRKREEPRIETINWPGHPTHKKEAYVNPVIINYAFSYVVGVLKGLLTAINDPASKMPDFDLPEEVLEKFRTVMGDDEAAIELLRENFTDLHGASRYFDSFLTEGLNQGRKFYQAYGEPEEKIRAALAASMQKWGRRYPDAGYGGMFVHWLWERHPNPYNSFGNRGPAQRSGPITAMWRPVREPCRKRSPHFLKGKILRTWCARRFLWAATAIR